MPCIWPFYMYSCGPWVTVAFNWNVSILFLYLVLVVMQFHCLPTEGAGKRGNWAISLLFWMRSVTGGMPFCPTVSVVSAICFVLCKKRTKPSRSPPDSTDGPRFQTVFTFLHNRLEALTLRPFEQLISECINAGDTLFSILVNSLSSPPLSQFCRLCLRSAFHPSQSTSLCRTDTRLSVSSLSLSVSVWCWWAAADCCRWSGSVQTAGGRGGFVWGAQRTTGCLILSFMFSFYIYPANAVAQRATEENVLQKKRGKCENVKMLRMFVLIVNIQSGARQKQKRRERTSKVRQKKVGTGDSVHWFRKVRLLTGFVQWKARGDLIDSAGIS